MSAFKKRLLVRSAKLLTGKCKGICFGDFLEARQIFCTQPRSKIQTEPLYGHYAGQSGHAFKKHDGDIVVAVL